MSLSTEQRDHLPDDSFAVPGKRQLPIPDAEHVRLAHGMLERTEGLTEEEKNSARERIEEKARSLGIDTGSWKAASTDAHLSVILRAMALNVPDTPGHPNKLPFKGILTRIDEPSDNAPEGSRGKRVLLTRSAAEDALPTLLGMPVDAKSNMGGHDVKSKVGTITAATIEGNAIHIEGFLYAADFPSEVKRIQSERDALGFSWEIQNIFVQDIDADPLVITGCTFTGAAILYKDKAAYITTSLAAQAEEKPMSKEMLEEFKKMLDETISPVAERLGKLEAASEKAVGEMQAGKEHMAKVEPHAAALESCAAAMEKDGIGGHPRMGHVRACQAMADHLRASAAMGKVADAWPGFDGFHAAAEPAKPLVDEAKEKEIAALKDQVASMNTKLDDMKASAIKNATPPERKTITPAFTQLLARSGLSLPDGDKKLTIGEVDKMLASSSLDPVQRMELKSALGTKGMIAA
jgi:hypothetical protein